MPLRHGVSLTRKYYRIISPSHQAASAMHDPAARYGNGGHWFSSVDQYWLAADYVDRILKAEKPADMPVQAPTGYQLVKNLNTGKTLGLDVPVHLRQVVDEVIE